MERRRLLGKESGYILYAITSLTKQYLDNSFINPLTIKGNGTVTYSSSNTTVATVNIDSGEVTIIHPGTAIISATVEDTEDCIYDVKTVSYTLTVAKAAGNVSEAPVANSPIVYDGLSHTTLISGGTGTGTMMYKLDDGEWSSSIPSVTNAKTSYIVYYKTSETEYYAESTVGSVTVTVLLAVCNYTAPTTTSLIYDTTTLSLLIGGSTDHGLIEYSSDELTWSENIPTGINAGTYTTYWRLTVDSNYIGVSSTAITTIIDKATPEFNPYPTGNNLVYNENSQNLITGGIVNYGTLKYSSDNKATWSTTIPSATNADDYIVWYKVEGDSNIYDISPQSISVTIDKVTPTITPPAGLVIIYDGEEHELISAGSTNYGTLLYSLDNITYSQSIPTASAQDTYTVWYKVVGDSNINDVDPLFIYVTLGGVVVENPTIVLDDLYNYVYSGSEKEPTIVVYDDDNNLISSDEYTITYSDNIDAGTATITITDVEGGHYTINGSVTFTITKAPISPIVSIDDWTYGDTASTPSVSGNTGGGSVTYTYSSDGTNYSSDIPVNAGNYYIKVEIDATSNYQSGEATNTFTIAKADANYTAPTAKTGLIYNGSGQDLLNAGSTNDGTILYSSDDSTWSTTIPQGTSATTYTSYWRLVGDNNHNDVSSSSISTSIGKVTPTVTAPTPKSSLVYNGSALTLINAGSTNFGTIKYSLNNSDWSTSLPSGTNGGTYTVYYKVDGDNNINNVASAQMSPNAAIGEKSVTASITLDPSSYTYSGNACTPSVVAKDGSTVIPSSEYSVSYSNNTNAGTATVTLTDNTGGNYAVIGSTTFSIARANISPSVSMSGWTYGGTASNPSVSGNSGSGTVTYYYKVSGAADSTYSTTKPSNAGTYTVKAEIALTTNYNSGSCTTNFTISKATQSAPTASGASAAYGSTATATASGGGGLGSIEWSNGNTLTGNAGSSKTTKARWSGNSNYEASVWSNEVTLSITKANQSAPTATGATTTYNTTATATASGGGGQGSIEWSNGNTLTSVGSKTTKARWSGNSNYNASSWSNEVTLTMNKASLSAPTATGATVTYGSTATATASGGGGVGSIEWSNGSTRTAVGSQTTKARWSGNGNYNASSWSNEVTLLVNRAGGWTGVSTGSMTITYSSTTGTRTSSGASGTLSASSSNTGVATVSVSGNTITVTRKGYGSATITVTAALSTNYNQASSTFTVYCNKADQSAPTATGSTVTYGNTATASASGGGGQGTLTWTNGSTRTAVGSLKTKAYWAGNTNYNASPYSNEVTLQVNQATGSASVSGRTVSYNGSSQNLVSVSGNTGTMHYRVGTSGSWSTSIPTSKNAGSWTIYYYMDASTNYTARGSSSSPWGSVTGKVNKIDPTITATPYNAGRTYNRSALYLLTGGSANVSGSFSYSTGTNAGSYTASWTFTPSDTTNYNTKSGNVSATISKATPVLSSSPYCVSGLTYDGKTKTLVAGGAMKHSSSNSTSVGGTFSYATAVNSGSYTGSWSFTPSDTTNYNSTSGSAGTATIGISTTLPISITLWNYTSSAITLYGRLEFRFMWNSASENGSSIGPAIDYYGGYVTIPANNSVSYNNISVSGLSSWMGKQFADQASLTRFSNYWGMSTLTKNVNLYRSDFASDAIAVNNFPSSGNGGQFRGGAHYEIIIGTSERSVVQGG